MCEVSRCVCLRLCIWCEYVSCVGVWICLVCANPVCVGVVYILCVCGPWVGGGRVWVWGLCECVSVWGLWVACSTFWWMLHSHPFDYDPGQATFMPVTASWSTKHGAIHGMKLATKPSKMITLNSEYNIFFIFILKVFFHWEKTNGLQIMNYITLDWNISHGLLLIYQLVLRRINKILCFYSYLSTFHLAIYAFLKYQRLMVLRVTRIIPFPSVNP